VTVMPCYDKKLEAVRPTENEKKEVDAVLATHEILDFLNSKGINLRELLEKTP
jgi:iron only hydrogenase large subunit-like protein